MSANQIAIPKEAGKTKEAGKMREARKTKAAKLPLNLLDASKEELHQLIVKSAVDFYHDQPKDLQVKAISQLVHGNHCFVCAGTGFGKTRIAEMFFNLFKTKSVVLVLNPLDSLGDDQVCEIMLASYGSRYLILALRSVKRH